MRNTPPTECEIDERENEHGTIDSPVCTNADAKKTL